MTGHITLSQLARRWEIKPTILSNLLWMREIDGDRCPLLGRVRWIPLSYVPAIWKLLVAKGNLQPSSRRKSPATV